MKLKDINPEQAIGLALACAMAGFVIYGLVLMSLAAIFVVQSVIEYPRTMGASAVAAVAVGCAIWWWRR